MNNDLISRAVAIEIAMKYCPDDDGSCSKADIDIREMLDELENLPTIDAEPVRHGWWKEPYPYDIWDCYECSCCSEKYDRTWNYCPNCGAKMDAEVQE